MFLRRKAKVLVAFFVMLLMCGPHEILLSMVMPRYFALSVKAGELQMP